MRWVPDWCKFRPAQLALCITLGVAFLHWQEPAALSFFEKRWTDFLIQYRPASAPSSEIVIAAVDSPSVDRYGRWPWPRARMTELIRTLNRRYQVRLIGMDIVFSEPEVGTAHDEELARAIREAGNVLLGYFFFNQFGSFQLDETRLQILQQRGLPAEIITRLQKAFTPERLPWEAFKDLLQTQLLPSQYAQYWRPIREVAELPPWQILTPQQLEHERTKHQSATALVFNQRFLTQSGISQGLAVESNIDLIHHSSLGQGHLSAFQDADDGLLRRAHLVIQWQDQVYPSLDLQLLKYYWQVPVVKIHLDAEGIEHIRLGDHVIEPWRDGSLMLNFKGGKESFPTFSIVDLIEGRVPPEALRDKIVLVGVTELGILDSYVTPVATNYPGVEVHATILDNLLTDSYLRISRNYKLYSLLLIWAIGLGLAWCFVRLSYLKSSVIAGLILLGLGTIHYILLHYAYLWTSLIYQVLLIFAIWLAHTVYAYLRSEREKYAFLEFQVAERTKELKTVLEALQVQHFQLERQHHQLQMTQTQLVQSEKMASLGTLVAGIAHEINNPANFTYNGAQNLERRLQQLREFLFSLLQEDDPELRTMFEEKLEPLVKNINAIQNGSQRIKAIVDDLKTFSRLDEAEQKRTSIGGGLQAAFGLVQATFRGTIDFSLSLQTDPTFECWPAELNQLFMNLMVNGCEAIRRKQKQLGSSAPGQLSIRTFMHQGTHLGIEFRDTGTGIPLAIQNKIFEPFFTTKEVGEGTGMGLSIAFGIVQKHQGKLEFQSVEGEGTIFTVYLPLKGATLPPSQGFLLETSQSP